MRHDVEEDWRFVVFVSELADVWIALCRHPSDSDEDALNFGFVFWCWRYLAHDADIVGQIVVSLALRTTDKNQN